MNRYSVKHNSLITRVPVILLLIIAPMFIYGQLQLSLNEAVHEGMVNNYLIKISQNETEMSSRNITYGNAGFLPLVTAYGSLDKAYLNAKVEVVSGSELENKNAEATITSAGIKAEWTLFDGAGMFADYEKLKSRWKMSDLETKITMENVVYEIILEYSNVIRQKELLQACSQRLKSSNLRHVIARSRLDSGMGSEQELLQSGVVRQADSTAWVKQYAELRKSKILLNRLLAVDVQRDFSPEDSIRLAGIPDLNQLTANSLQLNNFIRMNAEQLMFSKLEVKSLKSEQYPKLNVTGSYGYYENDTEAAFIKYNRYFGPQFGINIGMKLFDGMKLNRSIQNAKIEVQNKELLLKDMEQRVSALIAAIYLDYQSQLQSIDLGKEGLILAKKNLEIAIKAYQSGLISSLQLRVAQEDLYKASSDLVNAYYEAKVKETELLSISGMLIK